MSACGRGRIEWAPFWSAPAERKGDGAFGSSGGGYNGEPAGHGGGLIRLTAQHLIVGGNIQADGQSFSGDTPCSAGAGGGTKLIVGLLSRSGVFSADGGSNSQTHVWNYVYAGGGG